MRRYCSIVLAASINRRMASTSLPTLSILSWSVDSVHRSFRGAPRRASWSTRVPHIAETISRSLADVVALQDCAPEDGLAAALLPHYSLVIAVPNGKFGHLAIFAKQTTDAASAAPQRWNILADKCRPMCSVRLSVKEDSSSAIARTSAIAHRGTEAIRFLSLTCVDLSQRGQSLGGPAAAINGTATRASDDRLDVRRGMALDFVTRNARPDILAGNFVMKSGSSVSGYRDAWVSAGCPGDAKFTTDTAVLNRFYFSPADSGGVHSSASITSASSAPDGTQEGTPATTEATGRYQRCLLRHLGGSERGQHLLSGFKRVQTVVLSPSSLKGEQGVTFHPSDQLPLLTTLS